VADNKKARLKSLAFKERNFIDFYRLIIKKSSPNSGHLAGAYQTATYCFSPVLSASI